MSDFEIKYSTLLEDLNNINEKIKECDLTHINLTIDFENATEIPDEFDINLFDINLDGKTFSLIIKGGKLSHIGDNFLKECEELTKIILPPNIISVGNHFLSYSIFLKEIELPKNLEYVGFLFLYYCKSLKHITLPENLKYVGYYFLCNTFSLTKINAPIHLKSTLEKAKMDSVKHEVLTYYEKEKMKEFDERDEVFKKMIEDLFSREEMDIKMGINVINGHNLFDMAEYSFQKISDPQSGWQKMKMKEFEIKYSTFDDDLIKVNKSIKDQNLTHLNVTIDFEDEITILNWSSINFGPYITYDLTIKGEKLTHIGECFMADRKALLRLRLPDNIITIGDNFLIDCFSLKEIHLPEKINYVGKGFLCRCMALTEIHLPESLDYLGEYFLYECKNLTKINVPRHLKSAAKEVLEKITYLNPHIITYYEDDKE